MSKLIQTEREFWNQEFDTIPEFSLFNSPQFIDAATPHQIDGGTKAFGEGLTTNGMIINGIQMSVDSYNEWDLDFDEVDPNFDGPTFMEGDEYYKLVMGRIKNSEDPYDKILLDNLLAAKNPAVAQKAIQRWERDRASVEAADEHPWLYAAGALFGFAGDVAALAVMPHLTPAVIARNAAAIGQAMNLVAKTRGTQHAMGALKVGSIGALEGLGDTAMTSVNRTMLQQDYAFGIIGGALFGSLLGGIAPRMFGRVHIDRDAILQQRLKKVDEIHAELNAKSGGAAVPGADVELQALRHAEALASVDQAASTQIVTKYWNRKMGTTLGRGRILQGTNGHNAQILELAANAPEGQRNFWQVTGDIFTGLSMPNLATRANMIGQATRRTVADRLDEDSVKFTGLQMIADDLYKQVLPRLKQEFGLDDQLRGRSSVWQKITRKEEPGMPSRDDLEFLADQLAAQRRINAERQARIDAGDEDVPALIGDDVVLNSVQSLRGLKKEALDEFKAAADELSGMQDEFFQNFEDRLRAAGLVEEADMIKNYRPQIWNPDRVLERPTVFRGVLYDLIPNNDPDPDFVNAAYRAIKEAEAEEAADGKVIEGLGEDIWKEGESWADVMRKDSPAMREIALDYGMEAQYAKLEMLRDKRASIEEVLKDAQVKDMVELEAKWGGHIEAISKRIGTQEAALHKNRITTKARKDGKSWDDWRQEQEGRIAANYLKLATYEGRIQQLTDAFGNLDEMKRLQGKFKTGNRAKAGKLMSRVKKAKLKEARHMARKNIHAAIDEIVDNMGAGSGARMSDLPNDRVRAGNTRMIRRQFKLEDMQFDDRALEFMNNNSVQKGVSYVNTLGKRLAYVETMGPIMRKYNPEYKMTGTDADIAAFKGIVAREAEAGNIKPSEARKMQTKMDEVMRAFTDVGNHDARTNGWLEVILGATGMQALGSLVITQATDIPTAMMALPKNASKSEFIHGFVSPLKRSEIRETMEAIKKDDAMMYMIMRGTNSYETGRLDKFMDVRTVEDTNQAVYGRGNEGALGFSRALTTELGGLQNKATLAPFWNNSVQNAFGHVYVDAMNRAIKNWDGLSDIDKIHYSRLGIGELRAKHMKKALEDPNMSYHLGPNGEFQIPKRGMWDEELYSEYQSAIRRAQNEALLAPMLGDMPTFLKDHPLARLVYQFSSFAFAWGSQVARKAIQRGHMHPEDLGTWAPGIMFLAMGTMVMYMKNTVVYGKSHDEVFEKETPDLLWDIMSRTPFMTGMSNTVLESMFQLGGHAVNTRLGMNIVPQEANYFKRQQGPMGAMGPFMGIATGTYWKAAMQAAEGDEAKALERMAKIMPGMNLFYIRALMNIIDGDD